MVADFYLLLFLLLCASRTVGHSLSLSQSYYVIYQEASMSVCPHIVYACTVISLCTCVRHRKPYMERALSSLRESWPSRIKSSCRYVQVVVLEGVQLVSTSCGCQDHFRETENSIHSHQPLLSLQELIKCVNNSNQSLKYKQNPKCPNSGVLT